MKFFENFGFRRATDVAKEANNERRQLDESRERNNKALSEREKAIRKLEMASVIHEMDEIERRMRQSGETSELNDRLAVL